MILFLCPAARRRSDRARHIPFMDDALWQNSSKAAMPSGLHATEAENTGFVASESECRCVQPHHFLRVYRKWIKYAIISARVNENLFCFVLDIRFRASMSLHCLISSPDVHIPRPFRSVTMKSCTFVTIPFADRLPRSPSLLAVNSEISTQ